MVTPTFKKEQEETPSELQTSQPRLNPQEGDRITNIASITMGKVPIYCRHNLSHAFYASGFVDITLYHFIFSFSFCDAVH